MCRRSLHRPPFSRPYDAMHNHRCLEMADPLDGQSWIRRAVLQDNMSKLTCRPIFGSGCSSIALRLRNPIFCCSQVPIHGLPTDSELVLQGGPQLATVGTTAQLLDLSRSMWRSSASVDTSQLDTSRSSVDLIVGFLIRSPLTAMDFSTFVHSATQPEDDEEVQLDHLHDHTASSIGPRCTTLGLDATCPTGRAHSDDPADVTHSLSQGQADL